MLAAYARQLERALASGHAGRGRLAGLLTGLESGLRDHAREMRECGLLAECAGPCDPPPQPRQKTVERVLNALRLETACLCQALGPGWDAPDDVCRRVAGLADGLRRLDDEEARLALASDSETVCSA